MRITNTSRANGRVARIIFALLALACIAVAPAGAQVRVAATASNLGYSLSGLASNSAANPAVVFGGSTVVRFDGRLSVWDGQESQYLADDDFTASSTTVINHAWNNAYSSLAWDGSTMVVAGSIAPVEQGATYFTNDAAMPWRQFSLAPHTHITITSDAGLDLTLDGGPGTPAIGYGSMLLEISDINDQFAVGARSVYDSMSSWVGDDPLMGFNQSTETARTLAVSWENDSDNWADAYVRLAVSASGQVSAAEVSPVPEPGQWNMLCAGLMLASGWAARQARRRRISWPTADRAHSTAQR